MNFFQKNILMAHLIFLFSFGYSFSSRLDFTTNPTYEELSTCVRLVRNEAYSGYEGMQLVVETKDNDNHVAWSAKVCFCPLDKKSGPPKLTEQPAAVKIQYYTTPKYFEVDRTYCKDNIDKKDYFHRGIKPLFISKKEPRTKAKHNGEDLDDKIIPNNWLRAALFEFSLNEPISLTTLINSVEKMKIEDSVDAEHPAGKFPNYFFSGYSIEGGSMNCITFSLSLAKILGIDFHSANIDMLLQDALQKTKWGLSMNRITHASTVLGIAGGAVAAVALLSGPVGWGLVASGASGTAFMDGFSSYYGSKIAQASLRDFIGYLRHVNQELIVKEIYKQRNGNKSLIVRTCGFGSNQYTNTRMEAILGDFPNLKVQFSNWELNKVTTALVLVMSD